MKTKVDLEAHVNVGDIIHHLKKLCNARTDLELASKIPHGDYCYEHTGRTVMAHHVIGEGGKLVKVAPYPVPERRPCTFWSLRGDGQGSCGYLKKSDDDLGGGLLWDQVKECGVNTDEIPE